jgi:diguanylate cyclase (GGDEF)-like protein
MYHSKKIGVFVSHIYGNYQSQLCQGIIDKSAVYGYLVEIFSSNDGENLGNYSLGERSILRIPNFEKFSGIIFASGTYLVAELENQIRSVLEGECKCPIVEVNQISSSFPSIALDNHSPIEQLVLHLITKHRHKRICYLGNCVEIIDSNKHHDSYLKAMATHHLPVSDCDYFCCDYNYKDINKALDIFLQDEKKLDAIVCYNDRMAFLMMAVLINRGYRVPQDIALTGCDTLDIGQNCNPPITSVTFPIKELGFAAVETLLKLLDSETVPSTTIVKAMPHIAGSCGCLNYYNDNEIFYSHQLVSQIETLELSIIKNMNMSSTLHGMVDLDKGMDTLEQYIGYIDNCKELYLCLYSNWNFVSTHIRNLTNSEEVEDKDTIMLKYAMKDGKRLHECTFSSKNSLPDYIYEKSSSAYIYTPLFFGEMEFGYIALSYIGNQLSYPFNFISWQMNVNSMLKHISDNTRIELLVNHLEVLYQKDELTGLNNHNGFIHMSNLLVEKVQDNKEPLLAVVFDLDELEILNTNFGQQEGNFAVQILGHALESAIKDGDICARIFGGKFYLLTLRSTQDHAISYINKVRRYLDNYNKLHTKSYNIYTSCGYSIKCVDAFFTLLDLFSLADNNMSEESKRKTEPL